MEKRKTNLIISLIIIVVVIVACSYLFSDKLFLKRKIVLNKTDNDKKQICIYSVLPNPYELSDEEKTDIIDILSKNNLNIEIDADTLSIDVIDNYTYQVEYELTVKEGIYKYVDVIWKKNGKWEDYGAAQAYAVEDYELIQSRICEVCSDICD